MFHAMYECFKDEIKSRGFELRTEQQKLLLETTDILLAFNQPHKFLRSRLTFEQQDSMFLEKCNRCFSFS